MVRIVGVELLVCFTHLEQANRKNCVPVASEYTSRCVVRVCHQKHVVITGLGQGLEAGNLWREVFCVQATGLEQLRLALPHRRGPQWSYH